MVKTGRNDDGTLTEYVRQVQSDSDAHALLMVAAPELLTALEACIECVALIRYRDDQSFAAYEPIWKQARAAIAKAKGEA